jgi:Domain of unknown function (DUF4440)
MTRGLTCAALALGTVLTAAGPAAAQTWTSEQQEIWQFEQKQWQMEKDKDASWIETMVHPNLRYWGIGSPVPQDKASLARWNRYESAYGRVLEQELYPIAATITGNVAVVQYRYQIARENDKKERETVWGHYTDVLIKENGKWLFIAWEGGDDPKK